MKKGEERKRLTEQLQYALTRVGNKIAESVLIGTMVTVAGRTYETFRVKSNLDGETFLGIHAITEWGETDYPVAFDSYVSPGEQYYLHNDFSANVTVADRADFLHFANNLTQVITAFEANEQNAIDALRSAFDRLRSVAQN